MAGRSGRVVVGVDGTLAGLQALRWAVDEARRRNTELCAVRVWQLSGWWPGIEVPGWRLAAGDAAAAEVAGAFLEALGGIPPDVSVHAVVAEGPVPSTLMGYAYRDDDLLVLGASRHRWRGVGRTCLRMATCPVVVIPAPALARAGSPRSLARQLRREAEEYVAAVDRPAT